MLWNRGLGAWGIQQTEVGQAVAKGDIQEAQTRTMQLSYANVRSEKAKITRERNPDKHSLEAVGVLKQAMDKEDKYLIYWINNSQFNGQPNYIFKSSVPMLSWQLIWIRMVQSTHCREKRHILMVVTPDV